MNLLLKPFLLTFRALQLLPQSRQQLKVFLIHLLAYLTDLLVPDLYHLSLKRCSILLLSLIVLSLKPTLGIYYLLSITLFH